MTMGNIAAYQEGYTDGYIDGFYNGTGTQKEEIIKSLYDFIKEQSIDEPNNPYLRGYNVCLHDLTYFIEEILT